MSRNTLCDQNLTDFFTYVIRLGYEVVERKVHAYEPFALEPPDGSGVIPFYRKQGAMHFTAPRGPAEDLVEQWVKNRKRRRKKARQQSNSKATCSPKPLDGGSPICDETPDTSPPW